MRRAILTAAAAAAALCLVSGCGPSKSSSTSADRPQPPASSASAATGALPVGPGPQTAYAVQPQPAPGSCHYRYTTDGQPLPDPNCTPGAVSPAVTQASLAQTICRPGGYTSTVRPPASITGREKSENAKSYGYSGTMGDAELDHLISLQLGGDPNSRMNLWVEPPSPGHIPGKGPNNPKDSVETHLHTALCKGQVSLAATQQAIATDWTTAEAKLGIKDTSNADPGDSE